MDETETSMIPKGFQIEFLGRRREFVIFLGGVAVV
jgi:hypothetical protein